MVVKDNLWQVEIGVIYNICYLNRTSVKQCITYTESVIVKSVTFSDSLVHKSVTLFGTISKKDAATVRYHYELYGFLIDK